MHMLCCLRGCMPAGCANIRDSAICKERPTLLLRSLVLLKKAWQISEWIQYIWRKTSAFLYIPKGQKPAYLLYMGCIYSTKEKGGRTEDCISLLDKAKLDFTMLSEGACCGKPIDINGNCSDKDLKRIAEMNIKTIIAPCAQCYSHLKEKADGDFNILHITNSLLMQSSR